MFNNVPGIEDIGDADLARLMLYQARGRQPVHAPFSSVAKAIFDGRGEVDLSRHGLKLDGRDETSKFEDAFALALSNGWNRIVMRGGSQILLTEAEVPAGSFDVEFNKSEVLCDFNGSLSGGVANWLRADNGTIDDTLRLGNYRLNGQYSNLVTVTAMTRITDIRGYGQVILDRPFVTGCAQDGTVPDLIIDRDTGHHRIQDCYQVFIFYPTLYENVKCEGICIVSSDQRTRLKVHGLHMFNHRVGGTPLSVVNCAPGAEITQTKVVGLNSTTGLKMTNSALNLFTPAYHLSGFDISGVSNSAGIDSTEGALYYAHGATIANGKVTDCSGPGVRAIGDGLRVINVDTSACATGVSVVNGGSSLADYGTFMDFTETDINDILIAGCRGDGNTTADVRVWGTSSNKISGEIRIPDSEYPATRPDYCIDLKEFRHIKVKGAIRRGDTRMISHEGTSGTLDLDGVQFHPESGQSPSCIVQVGASSSISKIRMKDCGRTGALAGSRYDVNIAAGTLGSLELINSPTIDTFSVSAATLVSRDGKSYQTIATDAAFTLTPNSSPENTRHTGTLTADRAVTLSTTGAAIGQRFIITRTGPGAFNLNVGTGPLKALATDTWCEVTYDGSAWYLSRYGAL